MNAPDRAPATPKHTRARARRPRTRTLLLRALLAAMLGVAAALLVACGSGNAKLIPSADAGPLKSDFEAVAQEAETGDGSCTLTKAAIEKTEQDFGSLPATVDAGLRETMRQGIDNLRTHALALCGQPIAQTTTTSTTAKTAPSTTTTSTTTTPTTTTTTSTTPTTTTPSTTPTTTTSGGGTPAPGESPSGATGSPGGGTGVGESAAGGGSGNGAGAESAAGAQENGK